MLLFGHIGITLASVALGFGLRDKLRHGFTEDGVEEISPTRESHSSNDHPSCHMADICTVRIDRSGMSVISNYV